MAKVLRFIYFIIFSYACLGHVKGQNKKCVDKNDPCLKKILAGQAEPN